MLPIFIKMIRHVIWDWNGTLVNDVDLCVDILNQVLAAHCLPPISLNDYRKTFFFPVARFYQTLGLPSSGPQYEKLAGDYIKAYRERFKECGLNPGALENVRALSDLGVSQSILSAGAQQDVENFVSFYQLDQLVFWIDGANNVEANGKGDRAIDHLSRLDCDAKEVLLIGDTLHDLEVANLLGCQCLLFSGGHTEELKLLEATHHIIRSLSEVAGWVHD